MTDNQIRNLRKGMVGWFEPAGRDWRTCDSLVKLGLMEHNGAERGKGELYRTLAPMCPKHTDVRMNPVDGKELHHDVKRPHWRCELWVGSGVCGETRPING